MQQFEQKITLTHDGKQCIINNTISFKVQENQFRKEVSNMSSITLTLDEIEGLYNDLGIVEKAQQTEWSAEPNLMTYYSIPTIYAQTPLVYSDKSNV